MVGGGTDCGLDDDGGEVLVLYSVGEPLLIDERFGGVWLLLGARVVGGLAGAGDNKRISMIGKNREGYLVDPASSHMLVSKIKPCMCKYKLFCTVKLRMAH